MSQPIPEILTFLHRANKLKKVLRFKSSLTQNGDSSAEHSWRLVLMVFVIASELRIDIDLSRAMQIALVHDLAELQTDDIDAYDVIMRRVPLEQKQANEAAAMTEILTGISFGDTVMDLWQEYELQQTLEAKFVKALDKIEGFLHLDEAGTSTYFPPQFHGDYADAAVKEFDAASSCFPPLQTVLDPIKADLKEKFSARGIAWVEQT